MKTDQEKQFEIWFQAQPFYSQQVFSHGERLFIKDGDDYKFAAVRTAYAAFSFWQNLLTAQAEQWLKDGDEMRIINTGEAQRLYICSEELVRIAETGDVQ